MTENSLKDFYCGNAFPNFESAVDIWRGWIVPVGGATPDRHKVGGSTPDQRKVEGATLDRHKIGARSAYGRLKVELKVEKGEKIFFRRRKDVI